jgi:outer membrane protein assembly factor BamB
MTISCPGGRPTRRVGSRPLRIALRAAGLVVLASSLAGCDWFAYLGGPEHSSSSPDRGIQKTAIASLVTKWRWQPNSPADRPNSLFSTPATFGGRIFLGSNSGFFTAIDEKTGTTDWERDFGYQPATTCNAGGIMSSAAVADDGAGHGIVYLNAPDGYLYALDDSTGATLWRSVVQIPSATENDAYAWSSPTLFGGRVYVGISSNCDTPFVRGAVKSYDAKTGHPLATFWTMPPGYVGAGVWTSVASDATGVYVTTGSTTDPVNGAHPSTPTNAFDQYSMLKLDPVTLAIKGKWSAPVAPIGDPDFGSSPILFNATIAGKSVRMSGACNKDGYFYALRADTMTLVWKRLVGTASVDGGSACLSGGVWDGTHLFVAGNATTIGTHAFAGSVRRLNPATGAIVWQTGLTANPLGSGTINGNGILAYAGTDWNMTGTNGVYLLDSTTGKLLRTLHDLADYPEFGQPIWANGQLLAPNTDSLVAYAP